MGASLLFSLQIGKLVGPIVTYILSIAAQAFYFQIAQIFVIKDNRQGFLSLIGMVVAGEFISSLAYLSAMRFLSQVLPSPLLIAVTSTYLAWVLVVKYWYDTTWGRAILLTVLASALQLLTMYLAVPQSWSPHRGLGL